MAFKHTTEPGANPVSARRKPREQAVTTLDRRIVQVCEAVGDFIEYWGFKGVQGRIWTLLALSRSPLSQAEVARRLAISRASVSLAITQLMDLGLVRRAAQGRQAPFEAVLDVWPVIADILRGREWMLLESARLSMESALEEVTLAQSRGETVEWDPRRIRFLLGLTELAQGLLRLLVSMRQGAGVETLTRWFSRANELLEVRDGAAQKAAGRLATFASHLLSTREPKRSE